MEAVKQGAQREGLFLPARAQDMSAISFPIRKMEKQALPPLLLPTAQDCVACQAQAWGGSSRTATSCDPGEQPVGWVGADSPALLGWRGQRSREEGLQRARRSAGTLNELLLTNSCLARRMHWGLHADRRGHLLEANGSSLRPRYFTRVIDYYSQEAGPLLVTLGLWSPRRGSAVNLEWGGICSRPGQGESFRRRRERGP